MKLSLKLTRVGMNMEEATVSAWHKQPGAGFRRGEPLYDIETEKVTMAVEAPCDGTLLEIRAPAGANVAVGEVVCIVDQAGGGA
jgi:pyruvate/2-oxoglutarate dehydrogenase complex dihydrolipoamide acyltransferase (E2) component